MTKVVNLAGRVFERLTVISRAVEKDKHGRRGWLCICTCGGYKSPTTRELMIGAVRSCGCLRNEACSARLEKYRTTGRSPNTKHNDCSSSEYRSWVEMKRRCYDTKRKDFKNYGERGVAVCNRWLDKKDGYTNFLCDMGRKPDKSYTIGRTDNNGNYCPENCEWQSTKLQNRNRRNTILLTCSGKTMSLPDWAEELGVSRRRLYQRYVAGWDTEQILTKQYGRGIKKRNSCDLGLAILGHWA